MSAETQWTDSKRAFLALLILCDEADEHEALEQFPRAPGGGRTVKRRAAEWLASRIAFQEQTRQAAEG